MEDAASYQQSENSPPLCARGCGFFGSPATHNLCSKCYRDYLKEKANSTVLTQDPNVQNPSANNLSPCFSEDSVAVTTVAAAENNTPSKKKNRCSCCNKKVGLLGFGCRCGGTFCGVHRYAESHQCNFDFKSVGRAAIADQNPLVKADKMENRV